MFRPGTLRERGLRHEAVELGVMDGLPESRGGQLYRTSPQRYTRVFYFRTAIFAAGAFSESVCCRDECQLAIKERPKP